MYGMKFGNKHSYTDWGLIPRSRPVIDPPKVKTTYIDIPEADGKLDLTESLTGSVKFDTRKITCEFVVIEARKRWTTIYSEIMNYLHGQRMNLIFDEDPSHYYTGRFSVDQWKSDKKTSIITISGEMEPYKYDLISSTEPWLWDEFNFETDVIRDYGNLTVNGSLQVTLYGSRKPTVPTVTVDSSDDFGMQITMDGVNYHFGDGVSKNPNFLITDGEHTAVITGTGTISIDYRGGSL